MQRITDNCYKGTYTRSEAKSLAIAAAEEAERKLREAERQHKATAMLRRDYESTEAQAQCIIGAADNPLIRAYGWITFSD